MDYIVGRYYQLDGFSMESLEYIYELKKEVLLERLAEVKRQLQIIDEYEDLLKDEPPTPKT